MSLRRRSAPLLVIVPLLALAMVVAACGGEPSSDVTTSPAGSGADGITIEPAEPTPASASGEGAGGEPTAEPAEPTEPEPTEEPTAPEASDEPTESTTAGGADRCAGSDANRDFYREAAAALGWPVLCPVLPKGWYVETGGYRTANGGKLEIAYRGPGGAGLALSEGAFCDEAGGCVPPGDDVGEASLGPLSGTLVALDDGGWAIVVDRGENPSWLLEVQGTDEAGARGIGAAMVEVGD